MIRLLTFFSMILISAISIAQDQRDLLKTLKPEHPRLILQKDDLARIKKLTESDRVAKELLGGLKAEADRLLDEGTVEYIIVGPRLLTQSRRCLDRIYTLALLYLLVEDDRYLKRAVKELKAAADFPDWNPSHYLDTAEMTHAFAIGYDWLYSYLSGEEKAWIKKAVIEKGLNTSLKIYEENGWWAKSEHNWNQVCNGGIGIGALALADEEPEPANTILNYAVKSLPLALNSYAPDGGWSEGPGYWNYATSYTVYFLASLNTALGTDFGLSDYPGMEHCGTFRIHFVGPLDLTFNYADAGANAGSSSAMFWLAKRYNQPAYAWHQRQRLNNPSALDLVWYSPQGNNPADENIPLNAYYRGIEVAFFRSAWNVPDAVFVGFKGGDNKANHSHLDLGSFVLDAEGIRWAVDLGTDDYNLPGYFSTRDKRWTYYRLNTQSHNTLIINGENQDYTAEAPITKFSDASEMAYAIADLSNAYKGAGKVQRGIALMNQKHVLIQDEISAGEPVEIEWGMMTGAEIQIEGKSAWLQQEGKMMQAVIHEPANAKWGTESAKPENPKEKQNEGYTKLTVTFDEKQSNTRLVVSMTAGKSKGGIAVPEIEIKPLSRW